MATKLKNLKVTKVDFVDEGANPDAHIKLFKRKDEVPSQVAQECTESIQEGDKHNVLKRIFGKIAKATGMEQEETESIIEIIEKGGAESFGSILNRRKSQNISDEIWDLCIALNSALCSALWDEDLDAKSVEEAMLDSLEEFYGVMKGAIPTWTAGKTSGISKSTDDPTEEEVVKRAQTRLACKINKEPEEKEPKGDHKVMREIDKSKMTTAERLVVEDIEKRYGYVDVEENPEENTVTKSVTEKQEDKVTETADAVAKALKALGVGTAETEPKEESVFKGLTPELKAEMESLMKFKRDTEEKELRQVAKSYEIIGKKEDELYPVLKNLKEVGDTAYKEVIKALDQAKDAVEKSFMFNEIGKSGHKPVAGVVDGHAWETADRRAVELMKSKTGITKAQALDEVLSADPELAKKCEEEE